MYSYYKRLMDFSTVKACCMEELLQPKARYQTIRFSE